MSYIMAIVIIDVQSWLFHYAGAELHATDSSLLLAQRDRRVRTACLENCNKIADGHASRITPL